MQEASGKSSKSRVFLFGVLVLALLTAQWIDPGATRLKRFISPLTETLQGVMPHIEWPRSSIPGNSGT